MESSARTRNALLTTAGVLAAVLIVAIASGGSTSTGDATTRKPSDALTDVLLGLYLSALVGGAAMFVYLLVLHRQARVQSGKASPKSLVEVLASMFIMLTAAALLGRRMATLERPKLVEPEEAIVDGVPGGTTTLPLRGADEADVSWLPALLTVGLVALAIAAWLFAGRARRRARGELRRPLLAADVAGAVDDSLGDLRAEPDPRRAVIAAYARLERVVGAHGLPREPAEAPLEYLARMLTGLSVSDTAARALTDLFERAKFSQHAVGPEMKDQAIAALETVRDDLLAAQALAERERAVAIATRREQARAAQ